MNEDIRITAEDLFYEQIYHVYRREIPINKIKNIVDEALDKKDETADWLTKDTNQIINYKNTGYLMVEGGVNRDIFDILARY